MPRVRVARYCLHLALDAHGRAVPLLTLRLGPVNLLEHDVIDVRAERRLNGLQIGLVAVCRELYATAQTARHVLA